MTLTHSGSAELENQRNRLESDLVLNLVTPQNIRTHHEYVNAQVRLTLPPRIHYPLGFGVHPKLLIALNSISLNTTPSGSAELENQRDRLQSRLVFDLRNRRGIEMSTVGSHWKSSSIHGWLSQEIRLLEPFCKTINRSHAHRTHRQRKHHRHRHTPFCERAKPRLIGSPTCNADTVAIVLHDYCARVNSSTATGSV